MVAILSVYYHAYHVSNHTSNLGYHDNAPTRCQDTAKSAYFLWCCAKSTRPRYFRVKTAQDQTIVAIPLAYNHVSHMSKPIFGYQELDYVHTRSPETV